MKIEYLDSGSPDCPLIRIYGPDQAGMRNLRAAIRDLTSGTKDTIALHRLPFFDAVGACGLTLKVASTPRQKGVHRQTGTLDFEWVLPVYDWETVAYLIGSSDTPSFQWLQDGNIAILLSKDGSW